MTIFSHYFPTQKIKESEFLAYKDEEFTMNNMISEPKPLPDFSNQNLDINEALKLNNNIINDIEKFWVCRFYFCLFFISLMNEIITINIKNIGKS